MNLRRLVVPNVFVNVDLIRSIAKNYRHGVREIVSKDGGRLVALTKKTIEEIFILDERANWPLNEVELAKEYKSHEGLYRSIILAFKLGHLTRDENALTLRDQSPFNIDLFAGYFKDTYHALCQVFSVYVESFIPNWMLFLCMDI